MTCLKILAALALASLPAVPAAGQEESASSTSSRVAALVREWIAGDHGAPGELSRGFEALGRTAVPDLGKLLVQRPSEIPVEALSSALGRLDDERAIPYLVQAGASEDWLERAACVRALGQMTSTLTISPLVSALDDPESGVARIAAKALAASSWARIRLVPLIAEDMGRARRPDRHASLLGSLGGDRAHDALLEFLHSPRDVAQLAALQGLGVLGNPDDCGVVLELLAWNAPNSVRKSSCIFLGRVGCEDAVRPLIDVLSEEEDRGLVANAHWALRQITGLRLSARPDLWEDWWERGRR